jgi:glycerophosphoryl diester phosphodiesterase
LSSTCPEPERSPGQTRIIAHRGACGYLPEHTAVAKALAYGLGADFIEQDIVATKDQALVVLHDLYLDEVSDVDKHFASRKRDDGHYYVVDFTFEELQSLTLSERRLPGSSERRFPGRFSCDIGGLRIARFEDEIGLIAGLNASTGRQVGIYPEIKDPAWHRAAGIDLTRLVHGALTANRERLTGPVFVQSFDPAAIRRLKDEFQTTFPLVQLLNASAADNLADDDDAMAALVAAADGVGLPFERLIARDAAGSPLRATRLAARLGETGLLVHPYTMRRDQSPPAGISYGEALEFLINELQVDALFCDQPDDAIRVRDCSAA